jgi:hypothetical protein
MLKKLNTLIEERGKREIMRLLGLKNNLKLIDRITAGDEDYPFYLYRKIKNLCKTAL